MGSPWKPTQLTWTPCKSIVKHDTTWWFAKDKYRSWCKKMSRNYLLNIVVAVTSDLPMKNKNEEGKFSEDSPNGAFSESKNPSRFPMPTCIPAVLVSRATVGQKPGGFWSSIFRPHRYQICPIHEYMSQICSHYLPGRIGIRSQGFHQVPPSTDSLGRRWGYWWIQPWQ